MIALPKQKRVSTQKSKKSIPESEPIPIPIPVPTIAETKPKSYRQKLIEKIGIDQVRERERLSRQATKEKKAQAQVISV